MVPTTQHLKYHKTATASDLLQESNPLSAHDTSRDATLEALPTENTA